MDRAQYGGPVDRALPTKRTLERALQGAGLSRRQAQALLARGYAAIGHDDPADEIAELRSAVESLARRVAKG